MQKVIVIGCPGAGKSTFARKLRDITGLPLFYLDMIWHRSDGTHISPEEFDARLEELLLKEKWIIDGNYLRTLDVRLEACDTVFFLDYPLDVCLEGARSRIGKKREDLPWVEEEFDEEFRQWIMDFPKDQLPQMYELVRQYSGTKAVHILHSREEAKKHLELAALKKEISEIPKNPLKSRL